MASDLYHRVREREGRLYSDEVVVNLPSFPAGRPFAHEWHARADSANRLLRYVAGRPRPLRVLDSGCGNGWLSGRLAGLHGVHVWGLDRQGTELTQAARLFNGETAAFLAADIFQPPFLASTFDLIVIASAIQYFPDLPRLIGCLRDLLRPHGELHILDSPLYRKQDLEAARARTHAYYAGLGLPEMSAHYFHHTFEELERFSPRWLYRPDSLGSRLAGIFGRARSPFPWLLLRR